MERRSEAGQYIATARHRNSFCATELHGPITLEPKMTLTLWLLAGGLMVFAAAGTAIRMSRARSKGFTADQLSGDWLAQARAREEHPW